MAVYVSIQCGKYITLNAESKGCFCLFAYDRLTAKGGF